MTQDALPAARINVTVERGVAWLELANPARMNAISNAMWVQIIEALDEFEGDPAVRCVVFRGSGEKAFCSGADLVEKDSAQNDQAAGEAPTRQTLLALDRVQAFPKPTIAMIAGYCLGAGVALAVSCDLRVAGEDARFGIPAAKLGLGVDYSVLKRVADLIGPSQTKWFVFTSDRVLADEALRIGLVDRVAPAGSLADLSGELAEKIAGNAPMTISATKLAVETMFSEPPGRDLSDYFAIEQACWASEDYAEGLLAFKEKRSPNFKGR